MKPQQRKFIVEVKSARRRSTGRPASIWGDTDLKALVREAEAEVPHLFLAEARVCDQLPPEVTEPLNSAAATIDDVATVASQPEVPEGNVVPKTSSADASADAAFPAKPSKRSKRPHSTGLVRRAPTKSKHVDVAFTVDELASLQEANLRLKERLARKLRQENEILQSMLDRFEAH
ncbi:hypothetical protein [Ensifer adhaerens]|uniref:hypothetical protein n=1 Tax=Ensifer adhaerens TaxID=106592 RepID=UPI001C4E19FE|nr:hypothetical protein [Ensifer adhaerens]MBW0365218.1 hypothetical protein [Ensifer adhaerens]UCM24062.1 hypothetical protein LDL63_30365 [Ensifer adhaerens]